MTDISFAEEREPQQATERTAVLFFENELDDDNGFSIDASVDPGGQAINAVGMNISFDSEILQIKKIDTIDSFCELFIQNEFDNLNGTFSIACGKPFPGVATSSQIARISFEVIGCGWAHLNFSDDALVLANDGFGTDVLKQIDNTSISF